MSERPVLVAMSLLHPLVLNGHQRAAGAVVVVGIDAARQLEHRRQAVPAGPAAAALLDDAPALHR